MAWETANTVTTILSVCAVASSIGNYIYTNATNKKTRKFQYKLDQWHYLRDDISGHASSLQDAVSSLVHVVQAAADTDAARDKFREVNREAIKEHLLLTRALMKAQLSDYASDEEDWADLAYRPSYADNTALDQIGEIQNNSLATANSIQTVAQVATDVLAVWLRILDEVEGGLRRESLRMDPNYHNHI